LPAFLVGRAACPSCGGHVTLRYPLIEIALAATYAYLRIAVGPSVKLALLMVYGAILGLILVTDIERRRIPNVVIYPAIGFAAAAAFVTPGLEPLRAFAGGVAGFGFYLLIALLGRGVYGPGALGAGDVKLAAFAGLITGFPLVGVVIVVAILAAGVTSLFLLLTRIRSRRDPIPYAPFLITGVVVAALWGQAILTALVS
jgi:leader peptidase (prepilin peptidase)/N-methyltransferase